MSNGNISKVTVSEFVDISIDLQGVIATATIDEIIFAGDRNTDFDRNSGQQHKLAYL